MDRDLSASCQMFLIPLTLLFVALAGAGTEGLRVFIALVGLATASIWVARVCSWDGLKPHDAYTARGLSALFVLAWVVVAAAHLYLGWTGGFFAKAAG